MKNKRLKVIFKKFFKEEISKYLPGTKVYGLPNDYNLRVLYLLLMYGFYTIIGLSTFAFLAFFYLSKNDEFSYFTSGSLIISVFLLIACAVDLISDYSKSKDINILMTMPIKDEEIYLSKFLAIILSKFEIFYFYILMIGVYLFNMGFSFTRILGQIINVFPIFVTSLAIISIPIMLIMRFSNIRNYKTIFKFIGYGLALFGLGFIYFSAFAKEGKSASIISNLMKIFVKHSGKASCLFFHTRLYGKSLSGNVGDFFLYSFLLYLYSFIILFILSRLASKIYLDSLTGNEQVKIHKKSKNLSYKKSSTIHAIYKKDIRTIFKSPVYLFPVLSSIIMLTILWGFGSSGLFELIKEVNLKNKEIYLFIILGSFVFRFFVSANDIGINSSLSREGDSLYQTLTLPISPKENVLARALSINTVNFLINLSLTIVLSLITKINILAAISIFIGFSLSSLISSLQGLLMDASSINIHWEKERDLTRGSSQNIGYYIVEGFILIIVGAISFIIYQFTNIYLVFLFIMALIVLTIVFLYKKVIKKYQEGFFDL